MGSRRGGGNARTCQYDNSSERGGAEGDRGGQELWADLGGNGGTVSGRGCNAHSHKGEPSGGKNEFM